MKRMGCTVKINKINPKPKLSLETKLMVSVINGAAKKVSRNASKIKTLSVSSFLNFSFGAKSSRNIAAS